MASKNISERPIPPYTHSSLDVRRARSVIENLFVSSRYSQRAKSVMEDRRYRIEPGTNIAGPSAMTEDCQKPQYTRIPQALMEPTPLYLKSTVQTICVDDAKPIATCVNELANCIDRYHGVQSDEKDLLGKLM